MAELTAEYLDKKLADLKGDITAHFDQKIDEQTEALARMVNKGFEDVLEKLDVRDQVERHERELQDIKRALKLA